jgi:hypothetical protein
MLHERPLHSVSDDELLRRLAEILAQSRRVEADLVAHIGEVDARRLFAREASPSMFAYCTEVLHLSEAEAYLRIAVARAAREHPRLIVMLGDGRLHLTGIAKLAPYLTRENGDVLLKRATHRSKRQIEELVAELAPRPDAPTVVRKVPERKALVAHPLGPDAVPIPEGGLCPDGAGVPALKLSLEGVAIPSGVLRPDGVQVPALDLGPLASRQTSPTRPASVVVHPLAPLRYRVQFTARAELCDKLKRLQALMRSAVPDGDLATLIEQAVTEKIERLEARRYARTNGPRKDLSTTDASPSSRHIPAAVRRALHERDGNCCR